MRITSINIPKEEISNGLQPLLMEKLGQVVLLAGKNGSGKSRVLDLIQDTLQNKPSKGSLENIRVEVESIQNAIAENEKKLINIKYSMSQAKVESEYTGLELRANQIAGRIKNQKQDIAHFQKLREWNFVTTNELRDRYDVVQYVPKNLHLKDWRLIPYNQIKGNAGNTIIVGIEGLADSSLARLQILQKNWFDSTHPKYSGNEEVKKNHKKQYDKIQDLLKLFLNTQLGQDDSGEATLFGLNLGEANLSDGQKVLLQLCVAIHSQRASLREMILFMDEPENHVHPSAILDVIDKILENIPDGQVWIATHSIALLSHFDSSTIHFVEDGEVSYAGNIPERVLESLLGDEDRINKLQDFISLPGIMSLNQFAFECLFHPEVLMTDKNDPQVLQIKKELEKQIGKKAEIKIIDFGAGQGRLLSNIYEASGGNKISDVIDYVAFDPSDEFKAECCASIDIVYGSSDKRYYNKLSEIFNDHHKESFDVIILCNVLHEIDPKDWLSTFKEDGDVYQLLTDQGAVLIVEDELMPRGEKAYQKGFIVLDTSDLKELFQIKSKDKKFEVSSEKDGRLKAHQVPKEYLARISGETRKKALKSINRRAKENVLGIRNKEVTYRNGRKHGFWIQQFANTSLALAEYE